MPDTLTNIIQLPEPLRDGTVAVEAALQNRRSVREYRDQPLRLKQIGQLLWAAQGITHPYGFRTSPSAGGLYPTDIYVVAFRVENLPAGVYRYLPTRHQLSRVVAGSRQEGLGLAAQGQQCVADAPAVFVFTTDSVATTSNFGPRGPRLVMLEIGHSAQNLELQAVALGLGTVVVAAFDIPRVSQVLQLPPEADPVYLIPAGWPW